MNKRSTLYFFLLLFVFYFPLNKYKLGANHSNIYNLKKIVQLDTTYTDIEYDSTHWEGLEIPYYDSTKQVVYHSGFTLEYNENHEQANWVAYRLNKQKLIKIAQRTDKFIVDPAIQSGSASNLDYLKSGYDRGHLAPAADMAWSIQAMHESFYFSNMSPQAPSFNRGIWKNLEEQVRKWASEKGELFVVTGPVLEENLPYIGMNRVSIPKYYYKVILQIDTNSIEAIGFVLPNENSSLHFSEFSVSVDSVEHLTGIDFFHKLPDEIENKIEQQICFPCWFEYSKPRNPKTNEETLAISQKCNGTTQKAEKCKNYAKKGKSYCKLHEP